MKALYDLAAPAKVNLFLHVVGRRADGYHLLQSVFVLIDWADTLHFERRSDGSLRRHDLATPLPDDDLCLRAARALQQSQRHHPGRRHSHSQTGARRGGPGRRQLRRGHHAAGAQSVVESSLAA